MGSIEDVLLDVHTGMAELKRFVTSRHRAAAADDTATKVDAANPSHCSAADLFDSFMLYVRSTVMAAVQGTPMAAAGPPVAAGPMKQREDEAGRLRALLKNAVAQLDAERMERATTLADIRTFNDTIASYRQENNVLQVYKDRIVELQAVINGTKKPGEVSADIGPARPTVVPTGVTLSSEQRRVEVANELARLTNLMKEKFDRNKADTLKMSGEKAALMAENAMLLDRVRVLESQMSVVAASSSVAMRELQRKRVAEAYAAEADNSAGQCLSGDATAGPISRPSSRARVLSSAETARVPRSAGKRLQPGECVVGGIVMERDVALWLRDIYLALLKDPEGVPALLALPSTATGMPTPSPASCMESRADDRDPPLTRPPTGPHHQRYGKDRGNFKDHVAKIRGESPNDATMSDEKGSVEL